MPFYDFRCEKCGHEDELFIKSDDTSKPKCTEKGCKGSMVKIFKSAPSLTKKAVPTRKQC